MLFGIKNNAKNRIRLTAERTLVFMSTLVLVISVGSFAFSQDEEPADVGISFSEPVESVWEFGMKVNSTGNTRGVVVTVPVPMDWPEQKIVTLSEEKTENVGRFQENKPTPSTRQLSFNINRIPGDSETGYIRFLIKKRSIIAPQDTTQFVKAKKIPRDVKTFLKPSPFIESKHKRIREIASSLKDDSLNSWQQVEKIYRWVRDNIEYKFDTQLHTCLEALDDKHGDCEELSSLFIAICRAQGIPARAVWIPLHTYPEFYLHDATGKGHWFPCQAAGTYEFGSMNESKPILQKGDRFRLPGQRKEVRYLRPSLAARDQQGELSIEFISRQVVDSEAGSKSRGDAIKRAR